MADTTAPFEVAYGVATDVGRVRKHNEDGWYANPPVFLVADGMGGHTRGDAAAAAIVQQFRLVEVNAWLTPQTLHATVEHAADDVAALSDDRGAPGSTLTGVGMTLVDGVPYWLVFNVGDSRTYLFQDDELEQITVDHSRVQELVAAGEITPDQARRHPHRNVITRALGAGLVDVPVVDQWLVPAVAGQRLLCCSDGLHGEVSDASIADAMRSKKAAQEVADSLVAAAVAAGGRDNVTVLIVDVIRAGRETEDDAADPDGRTLPNAASGVMT